MDRAKTLYGLVRLMRDEDDPLGVDKTGVYAGVAPDTSRELVRLWVKVLQTDAWLVPEPIRDSG